MTPSNIHQYVLQDDELDAFTNLESRGEVLRGKDLEESVRFLGVGEDAEDGREELGRRKEMLEREIGVLRKRVEGLRGVKGVMDEELGGDGEDEIGEVEIEVQEEVLEEMRREVGVFEEVLGGALRRAGMEMGVGERALEEFCMKIEKESRELVMGFGGESEKVMEVESYEELGMEAEDLVKLLGLLERQRIVAQSRVARSTAMLSYLETTSGILKSDLESNEEESALNERRIAALEIQKQWQAFLTTEVLPIVCSLSTGRVKVDILLDDRQGALDRQKHQLRLLQHHMKILVITRARLLLLSQITIQRDEFGVKIVNTLKKLVDSLKSDECTTVAENASATGETTQLLEDVMRELAAMVRTNSIDKCPEDGSCKSLEIVAREKHLMSILVNLIQDSEKSCSDLEESCKEVRANVEQHLALARKRLGAGDEWIKLGIPMELDELLCKLKELLGESSVSLNRLLKDRGRKMEMLTSMGSKENVEMWRSMWVDFMTDPTGLRSVGGE